MFANVPADSIFDTPGPLGFTLGAALGDEEAVGVDGAGGSGAATSGFLSGVVLTDTCAAILASPATSSDPFTLIGLPCEDYTGIKGIEI